MRTLFGLLLAICVQISNANAFDLKCRDYRPLLADDKIKRPEPPYCATIGLQFVDETDFFRCRSEMEEYRAKIDGYSDCLVSEQKQAIEQFNETVQSFNRKTSE